MNKLIGMIGGVSWESTNLYYKLINENIRARFGGLNSARILIYSLNYAPIVQYEQEENWSSVSNILVETALKLEQAGSELIILGCNTLHKVAHTIEEKIKIPFLHIADPIGNTLIQAGVKKVGLLGTLFTMEDGFYAKRLKEKFKLEVITPLKPEREWMDHLIYNELCQGKVIDSSRLKLLNIMKALVQSGAQSIILGCTELGMIVKPNDMSVPVYDSTVLHAETAVALSLK